MPFLPRFLVILDILHSQHFSMVQKRSQEIIIFSRLEETHVGPSSKKGSPNSEDSIYQNGLLVPGLENHLTVHNGSAYGCALANHRAAGETSDSIGGAPRGSQRILKKQD